VKLDSQGTFRPDQHLTLGMLDKMKQLGY